MEKKEKELTAEEKWYYKSLNLDIESIDDIESLEKLKLSYLKFKKAVELVHSDGIESYKKIITSTSQFFSDLKVENDLDLCNLYSYMLWKGIFSTNEQYKYDINFRNVFRTFGNFGMTIMNGKGVCLNNVFLLNTILEEMGKKGIMISNKITSGEIYDRPNIERNMNSELKNKIIMRFFDLKNRSKNSSNHICELISIDGDYFIYDPTNLCVFPFFNFKENMSFNGNAKIDIDTRTTMLLNSLSFDEIDDMIENQKTQTDYSTGTDMVKSSFSKTFDMYRSNENLFSDFHESINSDIEIVASSVAKKQPISKYMLALNEQDEEWEKIKIMLDPRDHQK